MARSTHAYVRGNTAKFYEWLAASPSASQIPHGPDIWICGDCHLGNLGPLGDSGGAVDIQIRDLDQTVIGNPAHDLIRLALSLATAARGSDLPGAVIAQMMEEMVASYRLALAQPRAGEAPEPDVVRVVKARALGRHWKQLARERIKDTEPRIPLGKRFWPLDEEERGQVARIVADAAAMTTVLPQAKEGEVRLVDAAYWSKGCSSLGLLRYAALVAVERGKYALLDIKQATSPIAPTTDREAMPHDNAQRVMAGAQALSPALGDRMAAARLGGTPVFLRELKPQDLKLEIDQFSRAEAVKAAGYLAFVIGRAHGRQMDRSARSDWRAVLAKDHASGIDAPGWLWRSVLDLSGSHEIGYLEHCRLYAASLAKAGSARARR